MTSDFIILFLPLGVIWRLNIAIKRKFGVFAVFATGVFACIASICRLVYTVKIFYRPDVTYAVQEMELWT